MAKEEQVLGFVCVECFQLFEPGHAAVTPEGLLICPHCNAVQPGGDDAFSAPGSEAGDAARSNVRSLERRNADERNAKRRGQQDEGVVVHMHLAAVSAEPELGDEDPLEPSEAPAELLEDERTVVAKLDPRVVTWRLRTSIGITYNFPGVEALMRWASGRPTSPGTAVTLHEQLPWKDFGDFQAQVQAHGDARKAWLDARQIDAPLAPSESAKRQGGPDPAAANAGAMLRSAGLEPAGRKGQAAGARNADRKSAGTNGRQAEQDRGAQKPAVDVPTKSQSGVLHGPTAWLAFGLGFLTGAAAILLVWYFGGLDALPLK
jgi:hypothetical protein